MYHDYISIVISSAVIKFAINCFIARCRIPSFTLNHSLPLPSTSFHYLPFSGSGSALWHVVHDDGDKEDLEEDSGK